MKDSSIVSTGVWDPPPRVGSNLVAVEKDEDGAASSGAPLKSNTAAHAWHRNKSDRGSAVVVAAIASSRRPPTAWRGEWRVSDHVWDETTVLVVFCREASRAKIQM